MLNFKLKGNLHKFSPFKLAGGAKLHKNFAQKLLAVSLCAAIMLLGAPVRASGDVATEKSEHSCTATLTVELGEWNGDADIDVDSAKLPDGFVTSTLDLSECMDGCVVTAMTVYVFSTGFDNSEVEERIRSKIESSGALSASGSDCLMFFGSSDASGRSQSVGVDALLSARDSLTLSADDLDLGSVSIWRSEAPWSKMLFDRPIDLGSTVRWSFDSLPICTACLEGLSVSFDNASVATGYVDGDSIVISGVGLGYCQIQMWSGDTLIYNCWIGVVWPSDLETQVSALNKQQRIRVGDPHGVLPKGTKLSATVTDTHADLDDTYEIEHVLSYNIALTDSEGNALSELSQPVDLYFEIIDGIDALDTQIVLVREQTDRDFKEYDVEMDDARWVRIETDHFSPYALIDTLSAEEKSALNSANIAVNICVVGIGLVLVLALGIMLRRLANKENIEK